jgi:23S rRNA pseudouridine1911/1915/1917 synthase
MRQIRYPSLRVIYEDDDVLVIDKPAGLLTSTVPRERRPTALAQVRAHVAAREANARVGLIHRLDRDASGLLVFSKNHTAYRSLKQQFLDRAVRRVYFALIAGQIDPPAGRIESRLVELPDGSVRRSRVPGRGERAVTHYQVRLETGRKHQIRVHLSERGAPILNDRVYSSEEPQGRLMLVAAELEFEHPRSGKRLSLRIDLPPEMRKLLA